MTFCFWFYIDHLVEMKKIDRWSILCISKKKPISNLLLCVYVYFMYIELRSSNKMTRWITYYNKKQLQLTSAECMLQLSKQWRSLSSLFSLLSS